MKISIKKLVFGLMIVGILMPLAAQAVTVPTDYAPLAPLPCIGGNGVDCTRAGGNGQLAETVSFQTYVQYTFNLLIALAAVAAVFMMVYGGFLYMTSSAVTTKEDGLKKVYNAVGGLALVLCSFLILKTINPQFVQVPVSLVTPLNLHSDNTSADWMTSLNNVLSTEAFNANQAALRQQIADANTQLGQLTSTEQDLASQIQTITGESDMTKACSNANGLDIDQQLQDLCTTLVGNQDSQNTLQSKTTLATADGLMDTQIMRCLGITTAAQGGITTNNLTKGDCLQSIINYRNQYGATLQNIDPAAAQKVTDYAAYAAAIVAVDNSVSTNMSQSPYSQAALKSAETAILAGGAIAGAAVVGATGGVGAVGGTAIIGTGIAAGALLNNQLQGAQARAQNQAAQLSIQQINNIVNGTNITDPDIKAKLINQANAIKSGLGAK